MKQGVDRGTLTLTKGLKNEKPMTETEKEEPGKLEGNQESVVPQKQREESSGGREREWLTLLKQVRRWW